jgi:hypothetical protein
MSSASLADLSLRVTIPTSQPQFLAATKYSGQRSVSWRLTKTTPLLSQLPLDILTVKPFGATFPPWEASSPPRSKRPFGARTQLFRAFTGSVRRAPPRN